MLTYQVIESKSSHYNSHLVKKRTKGDTNGDENFVVQMVHGKNSSIERHLSSDHHIIVH